MKLINHGVSPWLVEKVKSGVEGFFNLPVEEKNKFGQRDGEIEGLGQAFVVSEEQKLDWADMFYMVTLPTHMRKPHLFPKLPFTFRYLSFFLSRYFVCVYIYIYIIVGIFVNTLG